MIELGTIRLQGRTAIYDARNKIRGLAEALGYDAIAATRLATAVSEATREMRLRCREPRIAVALALEVSPPLLVVDFEARGAPPALTGLEGFFDTASNDALGSGKTSLGPTVIGVFPGLVGRGSLFAPAYQYVFDVGGSSDRADISRSQLDFYFVWTLAGGKNWLIVDPQVIFDHENDTTPALTEIEWGFMIAPKVGISGWLRPGFGIGPDKLYDWNLEAGIKFVWR